MPLLNLQRVISRLATPSGGGTNYTFTAGPTFTNVGGTLVPSGPGPSFTAQASWQPASGKTMRMLPEGTRADDVRDMWVATLEEITPSEARQPGDVGGRRGHSVIIEGVTYEVVRAQDWRANGGFWWVAVEKVAR